MDLRERYLSFIAQAVNDVNLAGDRISYDLGLTVMPGPDGQLMPVYILTLQMPTLVLGEVAQSLAILAATQVDQRVITQTVQDSIAEMRKQRDAEVGQAISANNSRLLS